VKRGVGMLVGIISILSCGAQYVPLDGGVVADETLRFVLKQTGGKVALTSKSTAHRLSNTEVSNVVIIEESYEFDDKLDFAPFSQPDAGCYVIYTSGKPSHAYNFTCIRLTSQEQLVLQKEWTSATATSQTWYVKHQETWASDQEHALVKC
jgi:non-ribosomal peptide synthetase component F